MNLVKPTVRLQNGVGADTQIEQQLRQQILSGKLAPGTKMPPTPELAREWRVSCTVVQRAMARLAASGFVERRPRQGTFIKGGTDRAVIGVLFGPSLTDESAYYYRAILRAIREQVAEYNWTCRSYEGLTAPKGLPLPAEAEVIQQLTADLRHHAFKGLIEFSPGLRGLGDWERAIALPKVIYEMTPSFTDIELDLADFTTKSVQYLVGHQCQKLTFLRASWHLSSRSADLTGLFDAAAKARLPQPQVESFLLTEQSENVEREIFGRVQQVVTRWQRNETPRPDALIVSDDISMRAVALALVHAGIKVPQQLRVVTMANDSVDLHYGIPVARYEFSVRQVAREMLALLWKRMAGETAPPTPIMIQGKLRDAL